MKIKPEELPDMGYVLLDSLVHNELIPFVKKYIRMRTRSSVVYWGSNAIFAAALVFGFYREHAAGGVPVNVALTHVSSGILLAFALVPLHEYLHALAFRLLGADKISFDVNLKKFYFMAIADQFVASRREFLLVALAPFAVITALLLLVLCFVTPTWTVAVLSALLTHASFCSGDFALLSYFDVHRSREVVTYDDKENGITHFYAR